VNIIMESPDYEMVIKMMIMMMMMIILVTVRILSTSVIAFVLVVITGCHLETRCGR
jgi:hypothetical protein